MSRPVVTVLIATFNRAAWLREALESVLAQSFTNYEIVVVDDGSTDQTPDVVAEFGALVRYVPQPNSGKSAAQNRGMSEARGTYVALLDDDDLWLPDKLEIQVSLLESQPTVGFVCGESWLVTATGDPLRVWSRKPTNQESFESLYQENFIQHSTVVIRRELLARVGGLDTSLRTTEDYDLWLRLARQAAFRYVDRPLAKYRQHPGGKHLNTAQKLRDRVRVVTKPENVAHLSLFGLTSRVAREFFIHAQYFEDASDYVAASEAYLRAVCRDPFVGRHFTFLDMGWVRRTLVYRLARPYLKVLHNRWRGSGRRSTWRRRAS